MTKTFRKFKPADDTYIIESHKFMSPQDIGEVLGCDDKAIKRRMRALDLEIPEKFKYNVRSRILARQEKAGFLEGSK